MNLTKSKRIGKPFLLAFVLLFLVVVLIQFIFLLPLLVAAFSTAFTGIFVEVFTGLENLFSPLSSVLFSLFFMFLVLFKLSSKSATKAILLNASFAFFILGAGEEYLQWKSFNKMIDDISRVEIENPAGTYLEHDTLGYSFNKNISANVVSRFEGEVLYDVTYSTNEHGWRKNMPVKPGADAKGVLFFGCSFTFGYGLEDHETFPYLVAEKLGEQHKVFNFSLGGYGPHQTLAALQYNLVDNVVDVKPKYAVFTAINDHLNRMSGSAKLNTLEPKYVLENGELKFKGHFAQKGVENLMSKSLIHLKESHLYNKIFNNQVDRKVALFVAIVAEAKNEVKKKYPECEFSVVLWDNKKLGEKYLTDKMLEGLLSENINVHLISDMLPDYEEEREKYQIKAPIEPHPNFLANQLISDYLVEKVLK